MPGMRVPVVMIGADLRVRRTTAAAEPLFHLRPTDVGLSLRGITPNADVPDLEAVIGRVLFDFRGTMAGLAAASGETPSPSSASRSTAAPGRCGSTSTRYCTDSTRVRITPH